MHTNLNKTIFCILLILFFISCNNSKSKLPEEITEKLTKQQEVSSIDKKQFIKDYENFTKEYCSFVEQFMKASKQQKTELAKKVSIQGMKFLKYHKTISLIGASLTETEMKKIKKLGNKLNNCERKIKIQ